MRYHHSTVIAASFPVLLMTLLLCGCQPAIHKPEKAEVLYTKHHTVVRAEPSEKGRVLVSLGANVQVVPSSRQDGFTQVSIDSNRLVGWVKTSALSPTTVKERRPFRRHRPVKKPEKRQKNEQQTPAAQQPATPPGEGIQVQNQPTTSAPAPANASSSGGIFSPAEAQAATIPPAKKVTPAPTPVRGKQARPEAFDPF